MGQKPTAGPWAVDLTKAMVIPASQPDAPVCLLLWPTPLRSQAETFANAQAISANPELIAAARQTVYALREEHRIPEHADDDYIGDELGTEVAAAYFAAREALRKAWQWK